MCMLKSHCLWVKMTMVFRNSLHTNACDFRVHRIGFQLKTGMINWLVVEESVNNPYDEGSEFYPKLLTILTAQSGCRYPKFLSYCHWNGHGKTCLIFLLALYIFSVHWSTVQNHLSLKMGMLFLPLHPDIILVPS